MRQGLLALGLLAGCGKLDLIPVEAGFVTADAAWFAEEETLFVFWEVRAEQGLNPETVLDITWETDTEDVPWTPVDTLEWVHPHVEADCGTNTFCGSASLHIPDAPRDVAIRLRYDRNGPLDLVPETVFNVVGPGPPHQSRSAVQYGVFDADNGQVQWRLRHRFPTIRNAYATYLGLRRPFTVEDQTYGPLDPDELAGGPYGYGGLGEACPGAYADAGLPPVQTDARAVFDAAPLRLDASTADVACARATVSDPTGPFTTTALARKNPEVRPAFPVLRSPVEEPAELRFFLAPCERTISPEHEAMQRQRLFVEDADAVPTTCIDDWRAEDFVDRLEIRFRDAIEAARPDGDDMVLVIGIHRDEPDVAARVEDALARVLPDERLRTSPRLAGAFVLDSTSRGLADPGLAQSTLWCPATVSTDEEGIPDASARSCPAISDIPGLRLGPLSVGALPILPTRRQYLDFIDSYSIGTAGRATSLTYLAPTVPADADAVDLGEFGVVAFLNDEAIFADPDDAFSYCQQEEAPLVVARSALMQDPEIQAAIAEACANGDVPEALCTVAESGLLTLDQLGFWHSQTGEGRYELGLFWEFPFLLRMEYEASVAGAITAFGLSVPFGVANPTESRFGAAAWEAEAFDITDLLTQCDRFCDHPTFDSAAVYQVGAPFREAYAEACYAPAFPAPGDGGFPLDP